MKTIFTILFLISVNTQAIVRTTYTGTNRELMGTIISADVDMISEAVSFELSYYDANSPRLRSTALIAFYSKDYSVGLALVPYVQKSISLKVSNGEVSSFKLK